MCQIFVNAATALYIFVKSYFHNLINLDYPFLVLSGVILVHLVYELVDDGLLCSMLQFLRRLPFIKFLVQRKLNEAVAELHATIHGHQRIEYLTELPKSGLSEQLILQNVRKYKAMGYIPWNKGFASGAVYANDTTLDNLSSKVYKEFLWANPLHPELFPDLRRMEAEVVKMCVSMFNGSKDACGVVTSGGTESIILACLAYRELARERGNRNPTIIIPESAHPAFHKAAFYFDIGILTVPVDSKSLKVDLSAMEDAIAGDTCMLVGSAPGFPHGIIDPIEAISKLGIKYSIPVHVDCCLGGFILPFMKTAGFQVDPFDFRLPGVTSISCDTHKYGFCAKGTSLILYCNTLYRSKHFYIEPNWSGGLYASPTLAGSRPGALISVCWATLNYYGQNGYVQSTRRIVQTTRFIISEIQKIPGLFVFGEPLVSVVAFGSNDFDIYQLSKKLSELSNGRGWILNNLQFPSAVHLCVTDMHTTQGRAEAFIRDVTSIAHSLLAQNTKEASPNKATIYGTAATVTDRSLVSELVVSFLDACYDTPDISSTHRK